MFNGGKWKKNLPSEHLFLLVLRWSKCDFPPPPADVEGTAFSFKDLDVDGDNFSKCLSNASLIRFRSNGPPTISDFDEPPPPPPPPRSLYISMKYLSTLLLYLYVHSGDYRELRKNWREIEAENETEITRVSANIRERGKL